MADPTLHSTVWKFGCIGGSSIFASLAFSTAVVAQNTIIPDETLGAESSVVTPLNPTIDIIRGGVVREQNLFHSFEEFSIGEGNGAYFITQVDSISNIFARITGGNLSDLRGILGVWRADFTTPNADLFLINPNGVIFGENAMLDVGGSFTATTASGVQFGDAGSFSAVNPEAPSTLLTVNPSAYFFSQLPIGEIASRSTRPDLVDGITRGLRVPNGESLTLLGGNVNLSGGGRGSGLAALGGRVEIGAVAGSGVVTLNTEKSLVFPENLNRADIRLNDGASVGTALDGGGEIILTGHDIALLDSSILSNGIVSNLGTEASHAGDIILSATNAINIEDGNIIHAIFLPNLERNSGDIRISSRSLRVADGAQLAVGTAGMGNSGSIIITVKDRIVFEGNRISANELPSAALSSGGRIEITTGSLYLTDGATLISQTLGARNSGSVLITATDEVVFDGTSANGLVSGVLNRVDRGATVNGGNVEINTSSLYVMGGARIESNTFGVGRAGDVVITAADFVVFEGAAANGQSISSAASVGVESQGDSGDIEIRSRVVRIIGDEGTQIGPGLFTSALGTGNAGNILIVADELDVSNGLINTFSSQTSGGEITIIADQIRLTGNSDLSTQVVAGVGRGGDITITARNFIIALDDSDIIASSAEGQGGDITLQTRGFFGENFTLTSLDADPDTLYGNDRVDINATGTVNGVVSIPDISFIENSQISLPDTITAPERLLAGSCIARGEDDQGSFVVTGGGNLPARPGGDMASTYSTGDIQSLSESEPQALWRSDEPMLEPTGVFELADGQLVLSQECKGL